jgi:NAD(P)-dependent dehydrogenase (short-subunit alcohol dehydrogenase family)
MSQRLQDKIAIITGAGSGIGAATAIRFVDEGAKVLLVDTNSDGLADVLQSIGNDDSAQSVVADVQDESDVESSVRTAVEAWGRVDIIVNNAGVASGMPLLEFTKEEFDRVLGVNLRGPLLFCKHAIPHMVNGGSIVNIASISSTSGIPGQAIYAPSKGGILQMTRQLAIEYAEQNIRVNAVAPGTIETPMLQGGDDPERRKQTLDWLMNMHPVRRFGQPEEVANAILFLASDEASFITGANLAVDGGYTAQ